MKSDIQIANEAKLLPISEIAENLGINPDHIESYGRYKAKLPGSIFDSFPKKENGKLVLVTAVNPTPFGEGKTTTSIGLGQAMYQIGKKAVLALREPSLGPVFGVKGGAAGGGYAQVVPMEDINLHFTGDMHAITSANNLLCAVLDNHLQQGNTLDIDPRTTAIKRCLDMNDRALRNTIIGLGGKTSGVPRENGFIITVATEVMAILCLATDIHDLKKRLGNIIVAYKYSGDPVFAKDLQVHGAMTALLKDAIKPNLVQTLENTPAIIHGGPFANIAHGCNSLKATKTALRLGDYAITEAGFGSDLGAEKFFDIKCRYGDLSPDCVVLVATVRALKYNGGLAKDKLLSADCEALRKGIVNLEKHIENMQKFGVPVVVAINQFHDDTQEELDIIRTCCQENNCVFAISRAFEQGGKGALDLANKVVEACSEKKTFQMLYDVEDSINDKVNKIAQEIYGAAKVEYSGKAKKAIKKIEEMGFANLPVCVAKTPLSLSDDPSKLGRPQGFTISVQNVQLSAGAGFIVIYTGDIMTMPGLPKKPAAAMIDIDDDGNIVGLS